MDHLSKEDTPETTTSWSKQCLVSHREGVVDKEKLHCSFISWSGQEINKQSFFTFLERSVALKTFPFFKKNYENIQREKVSGLLWCLNQHR